MYINQIKVIVLVLGISLFNLSKSEVLKVGTEPDYIPFSMEEDGKLTGFDVDITNALCEDMKVECSIELLPFDDLIPALQSGKVDVVISSMNNTPDRKTKVTFSNKYYHIPTKMVKPANDFIVFSAKNLMGKKIGVESSGTADGHLTKTFGTIADIKRYDAIGKMYKDIVEDKLDFIVADSLALKKGFLETPAGRGFDFFGPDLSDPAYYGTGAAVAVKLGNQALADRFSKAIISIRESGKYQEISHKYFGKDIYGF